MLIFVLTTTSELRLSRKSHLRDHPTVSVLLLAPVLTGILPVSVYSSASFHTACPCVHRVVPSPYVSVYFCPLFFSPLAVRFERKQRYETKN
jgi:hypothetical protein